MPIFITHGRYTAAAVKGMVEHPEDRTKALAVTSTTGSRSPPRTMPLIRTFRSSGAATGQRCAGSGSGAPQSRRLVPALVPSQVEPIALGRVLDR